MQYSNTKGVSLLEGQNISLAYHCRSIRMYNLPYNETNRIFLFKQFVELGISKLKPQEITFKEKQL